MPALQVTSCPSDYLAEQLDFHAPELQQLASDFTALPHLDTSRMHTNVQALRGLGRSVGQIKALVLKCPPVLNVNFEAFLSFFYSYGATPRVCLSSPNPEFCCSHRGTTAYTTMCSCT